MFDPEVLTPGSYTVQATYSNYIQDPDGVPGNCNNEPCYDLWMGAIRSTEATIVILSTLFYGFFSPVENPPVVNSAKAGQAIPVKWRITDASGAGISDPNSFKSLTSYSISCTDLIGKPEEAVEEYAAGASGLQYIGDGNWQYNWKTPNNYKGTCRRMILNLKDGTQHPADFKFK
jgi:hypothetical protein